MCLISSSLCGTVELMVSACSCMEGTDYCYWYAKGWCEVKCRYLSIWVGFLYTVVAIDPSISCYRKTYKKGNFSSTLTSTVNWMLGSTLWSWCRKSSTLCDGSTVHVSSTYCFQNLGGVSVVARALSSASSVTKFALVTDTGDSISLSGCLE